jgi:hypothetical protein
MMTTTEYFATIEAANKGLAAKGFPMLSSFQAAYVTADNAIEERKQVILHNEEDAPAYIKMVSLCIDRAALEADGTLSFQHRPIQIIFC